MNSSRFVPLCIAVVIGAAALAVIVAFSPGIHTWYFNRMFARSRTWHVSAKTVWATWSHLQLNDVRLERDGIVLTARAADATVAVPSALAHGRWAIQSLIVDGVVLDLSGSAPAAAGASTRKDGVPASASIPPSAALTATVAGWRFPAAVSLAKVQAEAEVRLPSPTGQSPLRVHVQLQGGPLGAGQTARLAMRADTALNTARFGALAPTWEGEVDTSFDASGSVRAAHASGTLAPLVESGSPLRLALSWDPAANASAFSLTLGAAEDSGIRLEGSPKAGGGWQGRWQVNADPRLVTALGGTAGAGWAAQGQGTFATDGTASATQLTGTGRVTADAAALPWHSALLAGALQADFRFAATRTATSTNVQTLDGTLRHGAATAQVALLQPMRLDDNGRLAAGQAAAPWLRVATNDWPIGDGESGRGGMTGTFELRQIDGGVHFVSQGPARAPAAAVSALPPWLAPDVTLTANLEGEVTGAKAWHADLANASLTRAGQTFARGTATLTPNAEPYSGTKLGATLTIDLDASRRAQAFVVALPPLGRTLDAQVKATLGATADLMADVHLSGHDAARQATLSIQAAIDDNRRANVHVPVRITTPAGTTALNLDGTMDIATAEHRAEFNLNADHVVAEHMRLLADALQPLVAGAFSAGGAAPASGVAEPAWGAWTGRLRVDIGEVALGAKHLRDMGGTFGLTAHGLELEGGRAALDPVIPSLKPTERVPDVPLEPRTVYTAHGALNFDPASAQPYRLALTGTAEPLGAKRLFGITKENPSIEGQFTLAVDVAAAGRTWDDLQRSRTETFHLTSTAGLVRLLATNVGDAIPTAPSHVSDTVATVGSAFGALLGRKGNRLMAENRLPKTTEAVLDFSATLREVAYDRLTATATRQPDGSIALSDIAMEAANERYTGGGSIAAGNLPLAERPLTLTLQLSFRGLNADTLAADGVLEPAVGKRAFHAVPHAVTFGGTLENVDNQAWHDLLAKVATDALPPEQRKAAAP